MTAPSPAERAIVEYRTAHPEDDDLPDGVLASLFVVQSRALGIALTDLGQTILDQRRNLITFGAVVWVLLLAVTLFIR